MSMINKESSPVEVLTFGFLTLAGVMGIALAWKARTRNEEFYVVGFYAGVSVGMLIVALEEISWTQHFFGFDTPRALLTINKQAETTLHNIGWLQSRSSVLTLACGLLGLVGARISARGLLRKISVPTILSTWFLVIVAVSVMNVIWMVKPFFDIDGNPYEEVVEMLIAMSALLFIWLKARMLSREWTGELSDGMSAK